MPVSWSSHNKRMSVITRGVSHETSSCVSPVPGHRVSPMSYHARRRSTEICGKNSGFYDWAKMSRLNQRNRTRTYRKHLASRRREVVARGKRNARLCAYTSALHRRNSATYLVNSPDNTIWYHTHRPVTIFHRPPKGEASGRFSEVNIVTFPPDPWALNYCMHTFPE